jgi:hypothetical protein
MEKSHAGKKGRQLIEKNNYYPDYYFIGYIIYAVFNADSVR